MKIAAILFALLAFCLPVFGEEIETIPRQDHILLVNARINEKALGVLMIDTGASYVVLSPRLAQTLGLSSDNRIAIQTPGKLIQAQMVTLESLQVGEIVLTDVPAIIQPMDEDDPMLAGVIGMSALSRLNMTVRRNRLFLELN